MQKVTLALSDVLDGVPIDEVPFRDLQRQLNRAVPSARWAYLGYLENHFCMDTVVSESKLQEVQEQAGRVAFVERIRAEPWPGD